ncbi:MAG: hypothetical protein HRT74_12590 [Flavobacteriales bacterium]|nr:hypothetical protein [Flavobacteriales bacterium]
MRHAVFSKLMDNKRSVEYVLEHLKDANFDPEFYKRYENQIVAQFNKEQNTNIKVKKASWKRRLLKI